MFTKILVALNLAEPHSHVFSSVLDLAKATGAELHLLNVLTTSYDYTLPTQYYPGSMGYMTMDDAFWNSYQTEIKEVKENGIKSLSRLCRQAGEKGVRADFVQASGNPGQVICNHAKTQAADLVVVGSHGRRGLNELLIGSVSSYIMHRAPCSVLIVHAEASAQEPAKNLADLSAA